MSQMSSKLTRERPDLVKVEKKLITVIGKRMKELGWSERTLAAEASMNRSTVRRLLLGDAKLNVMEFITMCQALQLNAAPLLQNVLSTTPRKMKEQR